MLKLNNFNVNAVNEKGFTPLLYVLHSLSYGGYRIEKDLTQYKHLKALLAAGADINATVEVE